MQIISHRGNVNGPSKELENNPLHILNLLKQKILVEIDVRVTSEGSIMLGHDEPQYIVNQDFLLQAGLWCHAKNLAALEYLLDIKANCFWHETDDFTLTSSGLIWTYPDKAVTPSSIIVDISPDWRSKNYNCYGVCVDYL
jgi:hypothetical protein